MPDYRLHGYRRSGSTIVELALADIGADYDFVEVDLKTDAQRSAGYAAVNPQRKLPALEMPDGTVMTESAAIVLALDRLHPEAGLMPEAATPAYATALRWMMFAATECYPVIEINDYPERFAPPGTEIAAAVREIARELWRQRWRIVEANLGGDPYLLAEGCCAADFYIAVVSRWAQQDAWRPANLPKIERLAAAIGERTSTAEVWRRSFPPPA